MTEREKLVELLAQRCEFGSKGCVGCKNNLPIASTCKEERYGKVADHLLANGVTVHEWISTKDRLPEKDVDVLVCDRRNNVFVAAVCASDYFSTGLSWRDQTGYLIGNLGIVSWQPLPKPTKEEQP